MKTTITLPDDPFSFEVRDRISHSPEWIVSSLSIILNEFGITINHISRNEEFLLFEAREYVRKAIESLEKLIPRVQEKRNRSKRKKLDLFSE